jgi:hypothetical protein
MDTLPKIRLFMEGLSWEDGAAARFNEHPFLVCTHYNPYAENLSRRSSGENGELAAPVRTRCKRARGEYPQNR